MKLQLIITVLGEQAQAGLTKILEIERTLRGQVSLTTKSTEEQGAAFHRAGAAGVGAFAKLDAAAVAASASARAASQAMTESIARTQASFRASIAGATAVTVAMRRQAEAQTDLTASRRAAEKLPVGSIQWYGSLVENAHRAGKARIALTDGESDAVARLLAEQDAATTSIAAFTAAEVAQTGALDANTGAAVANKHAHSGGQRMYMSKHGPGVGIFSLLTRIGAWMITPVGMAVSALAVALGAFGAASFVAAEEQQRLNKALALTGGILGIDKSGFEQMAAEMATGATTITRAQKALLAVARTGDFAGREMETVARGVAALSALTGQSVKASAAAFAKIGAAPAKSAAKLNRTLHFLTASVYAHIAALQAQGDAAGAARVAVDRLSAAMQTRADHVRGQEHGIILWLHAEASMWGRLWGAMKQATLPDTLAQKIKKVNREIAVTHATLERLKSGGWSGAVGRWIRRVDGSVESTRRHLRALGVEQAALDEQFVAGQRKARAGATLPRETAGYIAAARDVATVTDALSRQTAVQAKLDRLVRDRAAAEKLAADVHQKPADRSAARDLVRKIDRDSAILNVRSTLTAVSASAGVAIAHIKQQLAASEQALKISLDQAKITYGHYFHALGAAESSAIARQITERKKELAAAQAAIARMGAGTPAAAPTQRTADTLRGQIAQLVLRGKQEAQAVGAARVGQERKTNALVLSLREGLLTAEHHDAAAQLLRLRAQYTQWLKQLERDGDSAGIALAKKVFNARAARNSATAIQQQAERLMAAIRTRQQALANQVSIGAISRNAAQSELRTDAKSGLALIDHMITQAKTMKGAFGPQLIGVLQTYRAKLLGLTDTMAQMKQQFRTGLQYSIEGFFERIITGTESAKAAFADFAKSILALIAKIIAQKIALDIVTSMSFGAGGKVPGHATGALIAGPGSDTSDNIPAMLSPGEFVVRAAAVREIGVPALNAINRGVLRDAGARMLSALRGEGVRNYAVGGLVGTPSGAPALRLPTASPVSVSAPISVTVSASDMAPDEAKQRGTLLGHALKASVQATIVNEQRPGGLLYRPT